MFTQDNRLFSIDTDLGKDVLLLTRFSGSEKLGEGFEYQVELAAELDNKSKVKADALVGTLATLSLALGDDFASAPRRFFNGVITDFSQGSEDDTFAYYTATIRPWTAFLELKSNCRVFQDMSVIDVIKKIFDELKGDFSTLVNYEDKTTESYAKYDYLVQYNETDLNFVKRILHQEGAYCYLKHEDGKHTLHVVDKNDTHPALEEESTLYFEPEAGYQDERKATVTSWRSQHGMTTGVFVQRDNNFQMPSKDLESKEAGKQKIGKNEKLEVYKYGGNGFASKFNKPDERLGELEKQGSQLSKMAVETLQTSHVRCEGSSISRELSAGYTFELSGHSSSDQDQEYVLTEVQHFGEQSPDYRTNEASDTLYGASFQCQPKSLQCRVPTTAKKPAVRGVQRAIVVGPSGEEIWTDKYGRIRCQFVWDREGKHDENSSCWLRVVQPMAGQGWGAHFWPRIGHEVLVGFLDGDLDQPIVTGSMYNAENMPPYDMPDAQTRSGLKTRSTKDGSTDNFNELRFEDKKDEEEIYFHAEKDFNRVVENNDTLKVGFEKQDDGDQTIEIFNNQDITIGDSQASDGSQTVEIKKDRTHTIKEGNEKLTVNQGNRNVEIKMGNETLTVGQGNRKVEVKMGNDELKVGMGNKTSKVSLGKDTSEAMQSIELKVGSSSIKVDQMGVTIKGMMVKIEGQTMTEVKGLMTQIKGDAMLKAQGGIAMIN